MSALDEPPPIIGGLDHWTSSLDKPPDCGLALWTAADHLSLFCLLKLHTLIPSVLQH